VRLRVAKKVWSDVVVWAPPPVWRRLFPVYAYTFSCVVKSELGFIQPDRLDPSIGSSEVEMITMPVQYIEKVI
jgi:hypothetical protein